MTFARLRTVGEGSSDRTDWAFVRLLPLLGVFLLVAALLDPGRAANGDEGPILAAAHRLLGGHYAALGTTDGTKFLWHGPGLPALLAPLIALRVPLSGLRLTTPLLMFASVLMFHRLLRLRLGPRGALLGAWALGLYGPAYYVLGTLAKEPLALLLSISALDGTARYLRYGQRRHAAIGGLSLAALAMTRLEYGWVITLALAAGLLWWPIARCRRARALGRLQVPRRWALVCALGLVACLPWLTYTFAITHHPFYWGNSGGMSLYWMSSPSPSQLGEWHATHTVFSDPALAAYRPFFRYLGTLGPFQRDLELDRVAIVHALGHPAKYALNLVANLGRMFFGFPFSFTLSIAAIIGLILFNGTMLAGTFSAAVSLARSRVRSPLPPETIPYVLFAVVAFAIHLFPTAEPRMVVPIIPVPIWLIAQALQRRGVASAARARTLPPAARAAA